MPLKRVRVVMSCDHAKNLNLKLQGVSSLESTAFRPRRMSKKDMEESPYGQYWISPVALSIQHRRKNRGATRFEGINNHNAAQVQAC